MNTFDPTLVNKVLAERAITKLQHKLANLNVFTTDFSDEVRDMRSRTVMVPFISGASVATLDPTDFEAGDNALVNRTITMQQVSKTSNLTYVNVQDGLQLEKFADMTIAQVANKIEAMVFELITEANYGAATVTANLSSGGLTVANLKTLWGALPGDYKAAILADAQYQNFLPNDLNSFDPTKQTAAFGYDYFGHTGNGFAAAGTNIVGIAAMPNAIVLASAIPAYGPGMDNLVDSIVVQVPNLGISIQSNIWAAPKTRTSYHSFDVLFGAQIGDHTALKIAKAI